MLKANCFPLVKFRHRNYLHSDVLLMTDYRLQIRGIGIFLTRDLLGLWIFHPPAGGAAFERPPPP